MCMDCGANPREREDFSKHRYREYEVFPTLNLVLCDVCDADFASYDPAHFGLRSQTPDLGDVNSLRDAGPAQLVEDGYCPVCRRRLAFLRFLVAARDLNSKGKPNRSIQRTRNKGARR